MSARDFGVKCDKLVKINDKTYACLGNEIKLTNFTGKIKIVDRGWYVRLKNLFKPQKVFVILKVED